MIKLQELLKSERYSNNSYFTFPHPSEMFDDFSKIVGKTNAKKTHIIATDPVSVVSLETGNELTAYGRGFFRTHVLEEVGSRYNFFFAWNFLGKTPKMVGAAGPVMTVCDNYCFFNPAFSQTVSLVTDRQRLLDLMASWADSASADYKIQLDILDKLEKKELTLHQAEAFQMALLKRSFSNGSKYGPQLILDGARALVDDKSMYYNTFNANGIYQAMTFKPSREKKYVDTIVPKLTAFTQDYLEVLENYG